MINMVVAFYRKIPSLRFKSKSKFYLINAKVLGVIFCVLLMLPFSQFVIEINYQWPNYIFKRDICKS